MMLLTFAIIILCITPALCTPCPDGCAGGCKEADCTSCIAGRWGESCENSCESSNCFENERNRQFGTCDGSCKPDFALIMPYKMCLNKCPQTCHTCVIRLGLSILVQLICKYCNEGYTGYPHCQYSCAGCIDNLCNISEGSRISQCTQGCMEGYFTNSDLEYSKNISIFNFSPPVIEAISICKKCKDNCTSCSSLESCTSCIPGTYGQSCDHRCDPNCRNTACNLTTGICENGCLSGYYTNGTTCESCPTCWNCRTDPCKSSCCQATTQPICSIENCDVCSEIDLDLCKTCLDGYILTKIGTCGSNDGLLTSGSSKGDDDDIEIGLAIGSSTFVITLVAGIVVAIRIIVRKRLRQGDLNQTETGEHVYLNDEMHGNSPDTDGRFQNIVGNSRNTDGNSQNIVGNCGSTDGNSQNIDENSRNINGEYRSETITSLCNVDIDQHEYESIENQGEHVYLNDEMHENSPNKDGRFQNIVGNSRNTDGNSQNIVGNCGSTDGNSQNIDENSRNINGEYRSETITSLFNVDIDQHEYETIENQGEHVYLNDEMHGNSPNTDGRFQNIVGNSRNTDGNSQNIVGNCGSTDGNSQNIDENSRNINGEYRSETITSLFNVDIDQHEYETIENQG